MTKFFSVLFVALLHTTALLAQPFINEIRQFRKADSLQPPPSKPILLIGSSSFTNWKDVQTYFPAHTILNRGFGGSSLPHLILYAEDIIFKYDPQQIVIYCGENDLTGGPQINADSILNRFTRLFTLIRSRLPKVPVVYISMKPSPSRRMYLPVMQEGNRRIQAFLSKQKKTGFVDVYSAMLKQDGSIMSDIFLSDSLHMNKKGYQLWQPLIAPKLLKPTHAYFPARHPLVNITGRSQAVDDKSVKVWASGAYMTIRFRGTECFMDLEDEQRWGKNQQYLSIIVDQGAPRRIKLSGKRMRLALATGLAPGEHQLTVCKDTEGGIGFLQINGVICAQLLPARMPQRRIEFIGNSITCGTGSDLSVVPCKQGEWYDQHNAWMAYGPVTARTLQAQWHLTSESGIGLMRSCCNKKILMPQVFDKIDVHHDSLRWDFARYQPDLVTICLGQNDGLQNETIFVDNYVAFLQTVRKAYPNATLLLLNSPMASPELSAFIWKSLQLIQTKMKQQGDQRVFTYQFEKRYTGGCDSHPTLAEHQLMAASLTREVSRLMGWKY